MRNASRVLVAATLAGLTGCTSTQQETSIVPVPREDVVRVQTGDATADVRLQREDFISKSELGAARTAVWEAIPEVYAEVGLPQPLMDRGKWTAAVENHVAMRLLGKQQMSRFLSCGSGMSGEHADTRRIRLTVRTMLESPSPEKTAALTRVEATAYALDGTSTAPAECASRGLLEQMIRDGLRRRLQVGTGED
jgi:hypothetical protein